MSPQGPHKAQGVPSSFCPFTFLSAGTSMLSNLVLHGCHLAPMSKVLPFPGHLHIISRPLKTRGLWKEGETGVGGAWTMQALLPRAAHSRLLKQAGILILTFQKRKCARRILRGTRGTEFKSRSSGPKGPAVPITRGVLFLVLI